MAHSRWVFTVPSVINAPAHGRRRVLHYSHHSTGLGHLVRSLAVAGALAEQAEVLFCSGGRVPQQMAIPAGVRLVTLPPIGTGERGALMSLDPGYTLEEAWEERRRELLGCFDEFNPDALLVELFPFGRRKFAGELTALLERARQGRPRTIVSSVRDLLVDAHRDKQRHDDEAAARLDAYFDAVIVHGDPRFARLEETFRPAVAPTVPVYYSGFVAPSTPVAPAAGHPSQILVSTGGGLLGGRLLSAVVAAHESILGPMGATTRVITGPFMPAESYGDLSARADRIEGLTVERFVPDLASAIAESAVSVSLCGYNTSIDLLRAGVPAVVVPYDEAGETEQLSRARRLESLGLVTLLPAAELSPESLSASVLDAVVKPGRPAGLDLDGAANTAGLMSELMSRPSPRLVRGTRTHRGNRPPKERQPHDQRAAEGRAMSRAVVTGAAGFIGASLAHRLLDEGWDVVGVDAFLDTYDPAEKMARAAGLGRRKGFTLVTGHLSELDLSAAIDGSEVVFHLAGRAGVRASFELEAHYRRDNVDSTARLVEAAKTARSVRRLVYASSSSVYGDAPLPFSEGGVTSPVSPYGMSKLEAERLCLAGSGEDLETVALRYFTVYGPGQRPDMGLRIFAESAWTGRPITVFGDGTQSRDFTYVDDTVEATYRAASASGSGVAINVGGGSRVSLVEVLQLLSQITGRELDIRLAEFARGDVLHTAADLSRARQLLGFEASTPFAEGYAAEVAWVASTLHDARRSA